MTSVPKSMLGWAHGDWQPTPWWHPRRYLGGNMRSWVWDDECIAGAYDGHWEYRSFQEHARHVLLELGTGKGGQDVSS